MHDGAHPTFLPSSVKRKQPPVKRPCPPGRVTRAIFAGPQYHRRMKPAVARCHLLAEVLSADGMMSDAERRLLETAMTDAGLSDAERDAVRHFEGADGAVESLSALPPADRQAVVDALVEAALADGKLTPNETATVKRLAEKLGL